LGRPTKDKTGLKDLQILERIAVKGPLNSNQISREGSQVVISYPTVWRRLIGDEDSLCKLGFLSKDTKSGKYTLTGLGLLKLLSQYSKKLGKNISKIVEKWGPLLPSLEYLFQNWKYFEERGLGGEAIKMLSSFGGMVDHLHFSRQEPEELERTLSDFFRHQLLINLFGWESPETALTWYKAIRDYSELKERTISILNDQVSIFHDYLAFYEQLRHVIEDAREPDTESVKTIAKKITYPRMPLLPY
jgi:hypothetical protein